MDDRVDARADHEPAVSDRAARACTDGGEDEPPATEAEGSPEGAMLPVSVDVEIDDGRTQVRVTGDRDAAVVVESESGERIYLPPEDFSRPPDSARGETDARGTEGGRDSPYQRVDRDSPYQRSERDSPYQSPDRRDSPYQRGGERRQSPGLEPTADGFRILHPEPVTDIRLLR